MLRRASFLVALYFPSVRADGWDDFSNNLATDLAPFLSLFGEQPTQQYLSESITWLDYFIFAMGPIGILTALVSAVRVCGSPSLRAFIGRAQEGEGDREAELCSSTSRNVCELYNDGGIARVFGRGKILEVVHDPNTPEEEGFNPNWSAGIDLFRHYASNPRGKKEWSAHHTDWPPEEYAPNLSFNVGMKRPDDWVFVVVAVLGFFLQGWVLAFAAVVTYYLRWEKNNEQPPSYACPLAIIGTILVCSGVFLCAFLVGQSTKEQIFKRKRGTQRSSLYWVQPRQVLGDQTFESFCHVDLGGTASLRQYTASWKDLDKNSELLVWMAVGITIPGFVLQFLGLRGIHSAISVAQLGVALVMSAARAALHTQRLTVKDNDLSDCLNLVVGYELDWLALRMGEKLMNGGSEPDLAHSPKSERDYFLRFCGMAEIDKRILKRYPDLPNSANPGGKILAYRRRLAQLTDPGPAQTDYATLPRHFTTEMVEVRDVAQKLVLAIESVTTKLFSMAPLLEQWRGSTEIFLAVTYCMSSTTRVSNGKPAEHDVNILDKNTIYLQLTRVPIDLGFIELRVDETRWRLVNKDDVEALLGLWRWSLKSDPAIRALNPLENHPMQISRFSSARRIVFRDKEPDAMGLRFWYSRDLPTPQQNTILTREKLNNSYTLWGSGASGIQERKIGDGISPNNSFRLFGWCAGEPELQPWSSSAGADRTIWTVPTDTSLLLLCAQEFFAVLLKSIFTIVRDVGDVEVQEEPQGYRLTSRLVSEIAEAFTEARLGSREDALLSILPQVVLKEDFAGRTPLWHAARNGHEQMVDELLSENCPKNISGLDGRSPLWQAASNGHEAVVQLLLLHGDTGSNTGDLAGVTPLSQAAANGHEAVVQVLLEKGEIDVNFQDNEGRTALWCAVANGHQAAVRLLLEEGADMNIPDNHSITPLRKAMDEGHEAIVNLLGEDARGLGYESFGSRVDFTEDDVKTNLAREYYLYYDQFLKQYLPSKKYQGLHGEGWRPPIRIAILTTGVNRDAIEKLLHYRKPRVGKIRFDDCIKWKSWVDDNMHDFAGHGTHVTYLTLQYAPFATIYIAKVTKEGRIMLEDVHMIAEAITWAVQECEADIIVIPLGFPSKVKEIKDALTLAHKRSKAVFAAAAGIGFNSRRCFPASSLHSIAIHAVDGRGKDCGVSAAPVKGDYNFSALGIAVESWWEGKTKFISGPSYATAIAAGAAASFLEFARCNLKLEDPTDQEWLCSAGGIREVLRLMSTEIDGYNCIAPSEFFSRGSTIKSICDIIMMMVRKGRLQRSRNVH